MIISPRLNDEEEAAFSLWGFGRPWREFDSFGEIFHAWNERHSDKLKLDPDSSPGKDIDGMIDLWKESCE